MRLLLILGSIFLWGPFFGLVGTVIAMLRAFTELESALEGENEALAEAINFAMVTTNIGVIFGLLGAACLIAGHVLKFREEPLLETSDKSYATCVVLNLFLGGLGAHHFYAGRVGRGIFYALTFGGFMIGQYIDFIHLAWGNFTDAKGDRICYKTEAELRGPCPKLNKEYE